MPLTELCLSTHSATPVADCDQLFKHYEAKGEAGLETYRRTKNAASIDGLRGLSL